MAYLNKQLQALVRAGLLRSVPGAHGGFLLAKRPDEITLMDVASAIEGRELAFQCTEICQLGMGQDAPAASFAAGARSTRRCSTRKCSGVALWRRRRSRTSRSKRTVTRRPRLGSRKSYGRD